MRVIPFGEQASPVWFGDPGLFYLVVVLCPGTLDSSAFGWWVSKEHGPGLEVAPMNSVHIPVTSCSVTCSHLTARDAGKCSLMLCPGGRGNATLEPVQCLPHLAYTFFFNPHVETSLLILEREERRERGRERNIHVREKYWSVASCTHVPWPSGLLDEVAPTESHQPGPWLIF